MQACSIQLDVSFALRNRKGYSLNPIEEINDQLYREVKQYFITTYGEEMGLLLHQWLVRYKTDVSFLEKVYKLIQDNSYEELIDEKKGNAYQLVNDELYLTNQYGRNVIPAYYATNALSIFISMFEPYLPLGTLVDLDIEQLRKTMDLDNVESFRVVITQRLASLPDIPVYFEYGALLYPFGVFENAESIYFSKDLIKSVVHEGFSDESDLAYLAVLKTELIINRSYSAYYFAPTHMREQARRSIATKKEQTYG